MKNKGLIIFLIILLSISCIFLSLILYLGLSGKFPFNFGGFNNVSNELVYDKIYEETFDNININTSAAMIEIKNSRDELTTVKIYGDLELLKLDDDKILNINYKSKPCIGLCVNQSIAKIEIYLPNDYEGNIEIENKYGDILLDEFLNSNIKVSSSYGDTTIDGANILDAKSSAGDIEVGIVSKATIENNLGDIKIKKVLSYLDINADCGDIKIDEAIIDTDSYINNSLGDIKIKRTNDIRIDAKTSLGDTKVENNNYKSDIVLKITNSCGDIKVNN